MCVRWYFAEHFSELSYRFLSKYKGRILDELRVPFNNMFQLLIEHVFLVTCSAAAAFNDSF